MDQITFEDELKREGFTQVENCIIRSPKISPHAKTLYFQLCSYAWTGTGYPGRETLALQSNVHVNTIDKYMNELKSAKLIVVKRRGFNKTNIYTIKKITKSLHKWLSPIHKMESHGDVSPINRESHGHVSHEPHGDVSLESHGHVKEEYEVEEDKVINTTIDPVVVALQFYQQNIAFAPSPFELEAIQQDAEEWGADVIIHAMKIAVKQNKKSYRYVEGILKRWRNEGIKTMEQVEAKERQSTGGKKNEDEEPFVLSAEDQRKQDEKRKERGLL